MSEEMDFLTAEQKALLRDRLAGLTSPEEMTSQLDALLKNVGDIVIIGQRMLDSQRPTSSSDDARMQ